MTTQPAPNRSGPLKEPHPDATRTGLPIVPCFYCGARGWCEHRQP